MPRDAAMLTVNCHADVYIFTVCCCICRYFCKFGNNFGEYS